MNEVTPQNQLAALWEACGDAVIGLSQQGHITGWNAGATEIYGYDFDEVRDRPLSFLMLATHDAQEILAAVQSGASLCQREMRHLAKGGREIEVTCNVTPVRDEGGAVAGAILVARDVTAQSRAARELRELQSSAQNRSLVLETASRVALDILASRTGVEALRLEVRDWGKGFNPEERQADEGHVGLQGMAERVNLLGGKWELQARPGAGTLARDFAGG